MEREEAIRRWDLVKGYCFACPKHGVSAIVTSRSLALQNAGEIYVRGGLESDKA